MRTVNAHLGVSFVLSGFSETLYGILDTHKIGEIGAAISGLLIGILTIYFSKKLAEMLAKDWMMTPPNAEVKRRLPFEFMDATSLQSGQPSPLIFISHDTRDGELAEALNVQADW